MDLSFLLTISWWLLFFKALFLGIFVMGLLILFFLFLVWLGQ